MVYNLNNNKIGFKLTLDKINYKMEDIRIFQIKKMIKDNKLQEMLIMYR